MKILSPTYLVSGLELLDYLLVARVRVQHFLLASVE
jgi:hypothetical protein